MAIITEGFLRYSDTANQQISFLNNVETGLGWYSDIAQIPTGPRAGQFITNGRDSKIYLKETVTGPWEEAADFRNFLPIAEPDISSMKVSPNGEIICIIPRDFNAVWFLGVEHLDTDNPPILPDISADHSLITDTLFYARTANGNDSFWIDNRYIGLVGGFWDTTGVDGQSFVVYLDTNNYADPDILDDFIPGILNDLGSCGGACIDSQRNLFMGFGGPGSNNLRTGEIKVFLESEWYNQTSLQDYDTNGAVIATGLLSANRLSITQGGHLLVGGGHFLDPVARSGSTFGNYGFSLAISKRALDRVLAEYRSGGTVTPIRINDPLEVQVFEANPDLNDIAQTPFSGFDPTDTDQEVIYIQWISTGAGLPGPIRFSGGGAVWTVTGYRVFESQFNTTIQQS